MTQKEALEKMAKYCAYQERCIQEVREKLFGNELSSDEIENIICELMDQNFIDEERFAKAYVRGKFKIKGWGRVKIKQHLKHKKLSDYCIKKGFEEINTEEYLTKLSETREKKEKSLKASNEFEKKQKLANFLMGRGFESELVWEELS